LDLRQLECFVAVAEELHFRHAGERLGLSQSALSDRISALEYEIGVPLLFRTTRQVSLTQAGAEFLRDATGILANVQKSVSKARHSAKTGLSHIRVSGVDEAISMLLPSTLLKFREIHPKTHIQILEISSSDRHTQELVNHRTDVAFVRSPTNDQFISCELLYRQKVVVVLAESNPLSNLDILTPQDIAEEKIVGYPKHARPILHDMLWSGFRDIGMQPNIICEVIDKSTLLQFVTKGLGIALAPAWVKNIAPTGVRFVPYSPDQKQIELYIAKRKSGNSPIVDEFISTAKLAAENFKATL
jgi:DNA-binding transcriptional LysR family regulator